jgi:hypothetical protein
MKTEEWNFGSAAYFCETCFQFWFHLFEFDDFFKI